MNLNIPTLLLNLVSKPLDDSVIQALVSEVEVAVTPIFDQTRATLLTKIAGPTPASFVSQAKSLFAFTDEQVDALWKAAIQTAADLHVGT